MRVLPLICPSAGAQRGSPTQTWEAFLKSVGRGLPDAPFRTRTGGREGRPYIAVVFSAPRFPPLRAGFFIGAGKPEKCTIPQQSFKKFHCFFPACSV